jgi:hypothetical protein
MTHLQPEERQDRRQFMLRYDGNLTTISVVNGTAEWNGKNRTVGVGLRVGIQLTDGTYCVGCDCGWEYS